mgnify:CR=1 FL=1
MSSQNRDALFLYGENARIKLKDLASILRKSPQLLKYTLRTLEQDKTVNLPHTVFDYSYFGLLLFRVYFKGAYISERDKAAILRELNSNTYVTSVYELEGEFDLAIEIIAPNPSRFNKELKKVANIIPTLNNYKVLLNVVTHIYPRFYLPRNPLLLEQGGNEIVIGGDRNIVSFEPNEIAVLHVLLENPKIRISSLAKATKLNNKTVTTIHKDLQKRKIIRGFKYIIDTSQLGVYKFRLFLKLHNVSQEREADLLSYMLRMKEIIQVNKTVGDWDIEVDIESLDKARVRFISLEMRETFKDILQSFNIIEFYGWYKRSYLPQYLFEEGKDQSTPKK